MLSTKKVVIFIKEDKRHDFCVEIRLMKETTCLIQKAEGLWSLSAFVIVMNNPTRRGLTM